jgi:hypothetical protein
MEFVADIPPDFGYDALHSLPRGTVLEARRTGMTCGYVMPFEILYTYGKREP